MSWQRCHCERMSSPAVPMREEKVQCQVDLWFQSHTARRCQGKKSSTSPFSQGGPGRVATSLLPDQACSFLPASDLGQSEQSSWEESPVSTGPEIGLLANTHRPGSSCEEKHRCIHEPSRSEQKVSSKRSLGISEE